MANASMSHREIRFLIDPQLTQVYVYLEGRGDVPLGVEGWHHKTFPASMSVVDILDAMAKDSPVFWPLNAPPKAGA